MEEFLKDLEDNDIKNKVNETEKWKEKILQNDLKYERNKYIYDFRQSEMERSFGDSLFRGKTAIIETRHDQGNL